MMHGAHQVAHMFTNTTFSGTSARSISLPLRSCNGHPMIGSDSDGNGGTNRPPTAATDPGPVPPLMLCGMTATSATSPTVPTPTNPIAPASMPT